MIRGLPPRVHRLDIRRILDGRGTTGRGPVIPNASLAAALIDRVQRDESIALDGDALAGVERSRTPTPTPTSTSTGSDSSVIPGLKGRTAAQQTCSIPRG